MLLLYNILNVSYFAVVVKRMICVNLRSTLKILQCDNLAGHSGLEQTLLN